MQSDPSPLLGPNDPPPFNWVVREPEKRFLLLNDHAGFRTPEGLGNLGAPCSISTAVRPIGIWLGLRWTAFLFRPMRT